jgi:hypothetical protein
LLSFGYGKTAIPNERIEDRFGGINSAHSAEVSGLARWRLSLAVRDPGNGFQHLSSIDSNFQTSRQDSSNNHAHGRLLACP